MTENQLYTSFRNEQALSTDVYDCANQDTVFDLEKYGPYLDKIRAFFVPSLEYRVHSLLKEFVYSTNSQWAKQFPCFKKFIDTIAMWKDPLNKIAEYNIDTMEEIMRSIIKRTIKDDVITCFLDSIILHHRLNKVCRELHALGAKDNILKSLNFVNERDYSLDCNCFTNLNTTMDCNINLNMMPCNAKEPIKYKELIISKSLARNKIQHVRPTTSKYRKYRWILDSNKNFLQQREDNSNHYSTCVATGSQNNNINKINKFCDEKPCNTKLRKIRNGLKLKIIHKVCLEDYKCSTFSNFNITRLPLPCKTNNLVKRIFEAVPSLTESCLIVIKQKFENSMYNVCSCLNSVLEKLNIKLIKALCLNCEIYPGYISFKLKANNIKKCLFVARVPICQNVRKCTIQQNYSEFFSKVDSKPSIEINESKCFERYKNNTINFDDTFEHFNETENFNTCSQLDQSLMEDMTIDMSQNKAESNNEKKIAYMITENVSRYVQNLATSSCNNSCKDIIEEVSNMTSCVDNSEKKNREYCKVLSSIEINCDDDAKKCKKRIPELNNSITKTHTSSQLANSVNCMCLSYENFIETNDEIEDVFNNKDLNSFSQTTDTNEHDWICSLNKKSNFENEVEVCNINTNSITSFAQNSEYDKQLVELNYNHFSNNNINAINERFVMQENDSSLNSAKVEIGCNSRCSCQYDDFIDITVIDDISKENIVCTCETSQDNFDSVETGNTDYSKTVQLSPRSNNLLMISVQIPKSTILSKEINMDTCHSRVWLKSNDKNNISTVMETKDRCNKITNLSTHALIISEEENKILSNTNKEIFNLRNETQDFITSSKRFSTSKKRFQSNEDSRNSGISTGEYLRAGNHSTTSNASLYYRSFATTSEFTINKRDEFRKSNKSKKLSKLRGRGYVRSRNGIRNITSTATKCRTTSRRYPNDYSVEIQPRTILAMTKFRNSVDKSVDRIKHLIRAKLGRILFNNKISNNNKMTKTFWRNDESSEDTRRKKTNDKCTREDYSKTSCSTCDCKQGYTTSSRDSSSVFLSICGSKKKRRNKENVKFHDHRLIDGSKTLLSFRSIKTSPWSYDLLTSTTENIEKQKLNTNNRYDRKKKIRNVINCKRNFHRCDFKHSGTSITISSQSAKVSHTENNSKYFGHYACKRQGIYDNKCICKQMHNQDQNKNEQVRQYRQYKNKNKYRDIPIKYINVDSNESSRTSLSHARKGNVRNVHQHFYGISKDRNGIKKFASSRKNRQIFEKDMSNSSDDYLRSNDSLRKKHIFAILTDTCNDYMNDLDLDFKLRLLKYVELCKSIKHSLMRTLRTDDIYEVNTA